MSANRLNLDYDVDYGDTTEDDEGNVHQEITISAGKPIKKEEVILYIKEFLWDIAEKEARCLKEPIGSYTEFVEENAKGLFKSAFFNLERGTIEFDWVEEKETEECVEKTKEEEELEKELEEECDKDDPEEC